MSEDIVAPEKRLWFEEQWRLLNRAGRRKYKNKIKLYIKANIGG
jgi:hypothetical protein